MYAVYEKKPNGSGHEYHFEKQTHLFGCNVGYIPRLLRASLPPGASEPWPWQINIEEGMSLIGEPGRTLMINLKPDSANLSLYELVKVLGYSSSGWTPVMFHMRGLLVDDDPTQFDERHFVTPCHIDDPIFSMAYLAGTISDGNTNGKWITPRPSSTNSVLLWPDKLEYFADEARKISGVISRRNNIRTSLR